MRSVGQCRGQEPVLLSAMQSARGEKKHEGKKNNNKNPIVSPPARLFQSNGGRTLRKEVDAVDAFWCET